MFVMGLTVITFPLTNRTVVINDPRKYNAKWDILSLIVSFPIPTLVCFIVVSIGTVFLIKNFNKSRELRGAMTGKAEKMSDKDAALVRSVTFICIIYIICATSNVLIHVTSTFYPVFHLFYPYLGNITTITYTFVTMLQGVSCSLNEYICLHADEFPIQTNIHTDLYIEAIIG